MPGAGARKTCAYRLANAGYQVVLANAASLYFDLACAKDGEEPGYYWAGFVGARDTFSFCPLDSAATAGREPMGGVPSAASLAAMVSASMRPGARASPDCRDSCGERTPTRAQRIEYLAAPRLIALAERAWAPDPHWEAIGAPAAAAPRRWPPPGTNSPTGSASACCRAWTPRSATATACRRPGGHVGGGRIAVSANVALPGLALHYTVDGSAPHAATARATRRR